MFSIFDKYPGLFTAFSEKKDGSMKIPRNPEIMEKSDLNRKKFLSRIGINSDFLVSAEIAHGNKVELVGKKNKGVVVPDADGLATNEKNLFLSVTAADCLPIFIYDPENNAAGIVHAGWRSLAKGILKNAIGAFIDNFNSDPGNILAGIGPAICREHYEIGPEVAEKFSEYPQAIVKADSRLYLDLKEICRLQLTELSIMRENIETTPECTFELPKKYFSARRDLPLTNCPKGNKGKSGNSSDILHKQLVRGEPEKIEAMMAVIGLRQRE